MSKMNDDEAIARAMANPNLKDELLNEERAFHLALGQAVSQWAWVEDNLCRVFVRILGPVQIAAASTAFSSIINFKSKLDAVDAAATVAFTTDKYCKWNALKNKLGRLSKTRNQLAHRPVYTDWSLPPGKRCFLGSPLADFRSHPLLDRVHSRFHIDRVQALCSSYQRLAGQLDEFAQSLPPPASPLQAPEKIG